MSRFQSALSFRKYGSRVPPYSADVAEYCKAAKKDSYNISRPVDPRSRLSRNLPNAIK